MRYQVQFVDDAALPEGVEWAFARQTERTYLFVRRSAIDAVTGLCAPLDRARAIWQDREALGARVHAEVGHLRNLTAMLLAGFGLPVMKVASAIL